MHERVQERVQVQVKVQGKSKIECADEFTLTPGLALLLPLPLAAPMQL